MWIVLVAALASFQVDLARDYQIGSLSEPTDVTIRAIDDEGRQLTSFSGQVSVSGVEGIVTADIAGGQTTLSGVTLSGQEVRVTGAQQSGAAKLRLMPGFFSLLPPLLAILLAVWLRQALIALFAGIWVSALLIHGYNPFTALMRCVDHYLPMQVGNPSNAKVILFTLALGGMVGIVARSGGSKAMVALISRRATSRRSGMLATAFAGVIVFIDDYANCLLVGNTVRPFTDARRISREKLSFIVDSTAAPVSTIALISTWTGYQLGQLENAGVELHSGAYDTFLSMLPYSFYAILCLGFVFMVAASRRDFGPMLTAEKRACETGALVRPGGVPLQDDMLTDMSAPEGKKLYWHNAVLPIGFVILCVMLGLYYVGVHTLGPDAAAASLREIISAAGDEAFMVLLWASFGGGVVALVSSMVSGTLTLNQGMEAWVNGAKAMVMAVFILVLAWGLGDMCKNHLFTGKWLLTVVEPSATWLPVITFAISGVIAFSTGSSFSTMAIVIPIAAPMIWAVTGDQDPARYATLAAVLSGAVFGDHCSPISDTTIMASMASASDHIDHVRTQAPYALLCAGVAAGVGYIPAGFGVSPWISLPVGFVLLGGALFVFGRRATDDD